MKSNKLIIKMMKWIEAKSKPTQKKKKKKKKKKVREMSVVFDGVDLC